MAAGQARLTAPLRVAGVGAGYFSAFHYDAWSRNPDVELAGIADVDQSKAQLMAERNGVSAVFTSLDEMIRDVRPDLIDIITPPPFHYALIDKVSAAGLPAICQKPFCTSIEEAQAAANLAREHGTLLVVHENFRFQPWYRKAAELIRGGAFGQIYQIMFRLRPGDGQGPRAYLDRQPYFRTMQRFLVHETAIHWIDTFRFLLGEPEWVFADLRRINPAIAGEDAGLLLFGYADGARALFDGNRLADHVAENRRRTMGELLIEGEKASLRLDGDGKLYLHAFGTNDWNEVVYEAPMEGFGGDCVFALQKHVTDHLLTGVPVENTASDYIRNIEIENAAYLSAEQGCRISLATRSGA